MLNRTRCMMCAWLTTCSTCTECIAGWQKHEKRTPSGGSAAPLDWLQYGQNAAQRAWTSRGYAAKCPRREAAGVTSRRETRGAPRSSCRHRCHILKPVSTARALGDNASISGQRTLRITHNQLVGLTMTMDGKDGKDEDATGYVQDRSDCPAFCSGCRNVTAAM